MNRILPWIGAVALLATFAWALTGVFRREQASREDGVVTLRIAHFQLEPGVSEAIDAAAAAYIELNPHVRIQQLRIPDRVWASWATTQLVGGTAPDIVQVSKHKGMDDAKVARYFLPLGVEVEQPNPYNRGTPLEGDRWRNTFVDGMEAGFNTGLNDYYGVPLFSGTVRMIYNRDVWREALGDTPPPRTFAEFQQICERAARWAEAQQRPLFPVAVSRETAPFVLEPLMRSQTQRLTRELARVPRRLTHSGEVLLAYRAGEWGTDHPQFVSSLEIVQAMARHLPPGFLQLAREDAAFQFLQGRALMIVAGAWDMAGYAELSDFEVGAFRLPMPAAGEGAFGRHVIGVEAERGFGIYGPLGITQYSRHPEVALDFLRFLTSYPGNRIYSHRSGWMPLVVQVPPPEGMEAFQPRSEGVPGGFNLLAMPGETRRVFTSRLHAIADPRADPAAVATDMRDELAAAVEQDMQRSLRDRRQGARQTDVMLEALRQLARREEDPGARAEYQRKARRLEEAQSQVDYSLGWLRAELSSPPSR